MNKNKRKNRAGRRSLAAALTMVMTATLLVGAPSKDMSGVQAATMPGNPRADSSGVMTWDRVYFGNYPQSDATGATSEPIKWRVLSVNGNDAFLVADCNLDAWQYHSKSAEVAWETSTIRSWLNGYGADSNAGNMSYRNGGFMNKAFTTAEQAAILPVTVVNKGNPNNDYTANTTSNNTTDKVFLLSYEEVTNPAYGFLAGDEKDSAKLRVNTAFVGAGGSAKSQYTNAAGSAGWWWLRTPGYYMNNAMFVTASGAPDREGNSVATGKYAVCPALHLNLSSTTLWSYAGTINNNGAETPGENPPSKEQEPEEGEQVTDPDTGADYEVTDTGNGDKTVEYTAPKDDVMEVTVPEEVTISGTTYQVTSIADNAFKNNKKIKKIVIKSNVKSIGKSAFMGCSNLQTVTMGENVTSIGAKAFKGCTKLKKITIPAKVNKIGKQAFYGCKNLKNVTVKTTKLTKKKVGSNAFKGTNSKATFKVPKNKLKSYKTLLKARGAGSRAKIKK